MQPCLRSTSLIMGGRVLSAIHMAGDQLSARIGSARDVAHVMGQLAEWLHRAHAAGWTIHIVLQAAHDVALLRYPQNASQQGALSFPFSVIRFGRNGLEVLTAERMRNEWARVLEYYRGVTVAASSREHGVMIPFGLNVATISLVMHDTVRSFARDVGLSAWSVELAPSQRIDHRRSLSDELLAVLVSIDNDRERVHAQIAYAQANLAAATASSMLRFVPMLHARLADLEAMRALMANTARPTLRSLTGRHAGQDVYVVGSGKSLDYISPDFFDGRVAIGTNQVYKRFRNLTYLVREEFTIATLTAAL